MFNDDGLIVIVVTAFGGWSVFLHPVEKRHIIAKYMDRVKSLEVIRNESGVLIKG